jgi:hypothetical protein
MSACRRGWRSARAKAIAGGRVTASSGGASRYAATSTSASCPAHPWLRVEDGWSAVSTFGFPWRQKPGSAGSGSYQAPVDNWTIPGRTASSTHSPARHAPRSLKIRTRSPSLSPRAEASAGCMRTGSRPMILSDWLCAPTSSWLCSRGTPTWGAGSPTRAVDPYPWPKPPPGSPIWPSMAASTTPSHSGCSPCWARCSDQLTVTMVRWPSTLPDQRHRLRVPAPGTHLSQPLTVADSLECPPVRQMHSHAVKPLPAPQSSSRDFRVDAARDPAIAP